MATIGTCKPYSNLYTSPQGERPRLRVQDPLLRPAMEISSQIWWEPMVRRPIPIEETGLDITQ
jgi:hypothetical protein